MQARFEQETKVQAAIGDSPYIVDVIDAGIDAKSGVPFLVMPLLKGQTLFERLQTGPLSWSEVSRCLGQLARAMDKAHAARVVHRDLKPSNLFLTIDDDGATVLKVLDFGIAKELVDEVQRTVTEVGTPAYAAPEQLAPAFKALAATRGIAIAGGISPQTDVWALGLIAYEMLTGLAPAQVWGVTSVTELPLKTVEPTPNALRAAGSAAQNLPSGFQSWFERCLAHHAAQRWPSFGAAVGALLPTLSTAAGAVSATIQAETSTAPPQPSAPTPAVHTRLALDTHVAAGGPLTTGALGAVASELGKQSKVNGTAGPARHCRTRPSCGPKISRRESSGRARCC